jgi:hypothetical protein
MSPAAKSAAPLKRPSNRAWPSSGCHAEECNPHYKRVEDEGRTFIQSALQDMADIEPTVDQLRITLAPLSSPHRSRALEALCEELKQDKHPVPGQGKRCLRGCDLRKDDPVGRTRAGGCCTKQGNRHGCLCAAGPLMDICKRRSLPGRSAH